MGARSELEAAGEAQVEQPGRPSWIHHERTSTYTDTVASARQLTSAFRADSSQRGKDASKQPAQTPRKAPTTEEMDVLKLKKAWELAIAPAKQLPMNAIGTRPCHPLLALLPPLLPPISVSCC